MAEVRTRAEQAQSPVTTSYLIDQTDQINMLSGRCKGILLLLAESLFKDTRYPESETAWLAHDLVVKIEALAEETIEACRNAPMLPASSASTEGGNHA